MSRTLITLALATQLSGCWFVFIPGSVIDMVTGNTGNLCARETAKVGDVVRFGESLYVIRRITGLSTRCQNPAMPILVDAKPQ